MSTQSVELDGMTSDHTRRLIRGAMDIHDKGSNDSTTTSWNAAAW
jgi:hypothetical protein